MNKLSYRLGVGQTETWIETTDDGAFVITKTRIAVSIEQIAEPAIPSPQVQHIAREDGGQDVKIGWPEGDE